MKRALGGILFSATLLACAFGAEERAARPNVLFISADDLRADLACYGNREVITPNLDRLAARGTLFERAYCQQSVCNPSRASLMTGRRPDTIGVHDLPTYFRNRHPDIVTLPQHFKQQGYFTQGIGKIYHNETRPASAGPRHYDAPSWSVTPTFAVGAHWQDWVVPGSPDGPAKKQGPVQCLDVPDNAYFDGRIADAAVDALRRFKNDDRAFFLAVGFWKPHLPFNAPKKYWDLYDRNRLSGPVPKAAAKGAPAITAHDWTELRGYAGMPASGPLSDEQIAELRHGYLAGISFLDAQVGRVLDELERLGLAENTIVVFWSDNGFYLGERDLWGKTTNYELDTRVPLIIARPGQEHGTRSESLVELLDLYPTLIELARLPQRPDLEGKTLLPVLDNPQTRIHDAVFSQHPQPFYRQKPTAMGRTVRTATHRYVEWRAVADGAVIARELYDHRKDPSESVNVADAEENSSLVSALAARLAPR